VQPKLVEKYQVGITPIREALQRLTQEGLIQPIARFGYVVTPMSLSDVTAMYKLGSVLAYDAVLWLADAMKRAGTTEGEKLKAAMEQTQNLPVLTGKLSIDPKTHNPLNKPAIIQETRGGKFVYVKTCVTTD